MTNSLKATTYIIEILLENTEVKKYLNNTTVLPVDARLGTKFPFCVVKRDSVVSSYLTKDVYNTDTANVTVLIADRDYKKCLQVASAVRNALERKAFKDDDVYISSINLTSANETLMNEAFIQMMTFAVIFEDK